MPVSEYQIIVTGNQHVIAPVWQSLNHEDR